MAPQSLLDWCATSPQVSKKQKTTDPSPVTDTSSDTGFADMSAAMETEDEKEQALHCDQYNGSPTGGEDDFEVDVGDEYAQKEKEEMLVRLSLSPQAPLSLQREITTQIFQRRAGCVGT